MVESGTEAAPILTDVVEPDWATLETTPWIETLEPTACPVASAAPTVRV